MTGLHAIPPGVSFEFLQAAWAVHVILHGPIRLNTCCEFRVNLDGSLSYRRPNRDWSRLSVRDIAHYSLPENIGRYGMLQPDLSTRFVNA